MAGALLIRTIHGFSPADDEAREAIRHHRIGSLVRADLPVMRNGAFFRKWWALVKLGFDYFEDMCEVRLHKGKAVQPSFDRFRKDITILCGHYHTVWNINGEMRLEADSLKWASMNEETFTKLYDQTIQVLLRNIFNGKKGRPWSEQELRSAVDQVMEFAA